MRNLPIFSKFEYNRNCVYLISRKTEYGYYKKHLDSVNLASTFMSLVSPIIMMILSIVFIDNKCFNRMSSIDTILIILCIGGLLISIIPLIIIYDTHDFDYRHDRYEDEFAKTNIKLLYLYYALTCIIKSTITSSIFGLVILFYVGVNEYLIFILILPTVLSFGFYIFRFIGWLYLMFNNIGGKTK